MTDVNTVTFYGPIRDHVGRKTLAVPGETVADVLAELCERFPGIESELFEEAELRSSVQIFIDGRKIGPLGGLDAPVEPPATIQITAAMSGG